MNPAGPRVKFPAQRETDCPHCEGAILKGDWAVSVPIQRPDRKAQWPRRWQAVHSYCAPHAEWHALGDLRAWIKYLNSLGVYDQIGGVDNLRDAFLDAITEADLEDSDDCWHLSGSVHLGGITVADTGWAISPRTGLILPATAVAAGLITGGDADVGVRGLCDSSDCVRPTHIQITEITETAKEAA